MAVEAALNLEELALKHAPLLSSTLRDFLAEGRATGAADYQQALKTRLSLQAELERFLGAVRCHHHPSHDGRGAGDAGADGQPRLLLHLEPLRRPGGDDPGGIRPPGAAAGFADRRPAREGRSAPVRGPLVRGAVPLSLLGGRSHESPRPPDERNREKGPLTGRPDRRRQVRQHVHGPGRRAPRGSTSPRLPTWPRRGPSRR